MAKRVNSFIFRTPYFKAQNGKNVYNFEMQNFEYDKQLSQNFFLFSFLQNELYYLGYKVLNVKVLPAVDTKINVNVYLLNNFLRFFNIRFKKIKKFFFFFKMCHFFFMHSRLIRRTLKRLRSHFVKYGYKKGYKLHKNYFEGVKNGFVLLQPKFFNITKVCDSFYMIKNLLFIAFNFKKINSNLSFYGKTFKLIFVCAMLTRLYYARYRYVYIRVNKKRRVIFKKKLIFSVLKEKVISLKLSQTTKTKMRKLAKPVKFSLHKKEFNRVLVPRFFKFVDRRCRAKGILLRTNVASYRLKTFIFYKILSQKMLSHSFLARGISVKYALQSYLRNIFKRDVNVTFMHLNFKNSKIDRKEKLNIKKRCLVQGRFSFLPLFTSLQRNKVYSYFSLFRKKNIFVRKHGFYTLLHHLKKFVKTPDAKKLYRKYPDFRKYYFYFLMALYYGDARLFNLAFCKVFKYLKIHKFFLLFFTNEITRFLMLPIIKSKIAGVHLQIRGKLDGLDRRKTMRISIGAPVKPQLIVNNFSYNQAAVETYTGSFGVKVWLKLNGIGST